MQKLGFNYIDELRDEMYNYLCNRKNMIFYDGIRDNLDDNIKFKFFYSSPFDPLEFIQIDVFNEKEIIELDTEYISCFASISIIKEVTSKDAYKLDNQYGYIKVDSIKIRGIAKHKINLYLNSNDINDIKGAIEYFERKLCKKNKN